MDVSCVYKHLWVASLAFIDKTEISSDIGVVG